MNVSAKSISKFVSKARTEFEETYKKLLNRDSFIEFINDYLDDIAGALSDYESIEYRIITAKVSSNRKTKQAMTSKFIADCFKEFNVKMSGSTKMDKATVSYEKLLLYPEIILTAKAPKEISITSEGYKLPAMADNFKKIFNADSFEEYIKNELKHMLEWTLDNDKHISSFKYMTDMYGTSRIENLIKKDIDLFFHKYLYEEVEEKIDVNMYMYPADFVGSIPIDPSNKKTAAQREGNTFIYTHEIDKNIKIKTIIDIPDTADDAQSFKLFNLYDSDVTKALIQLSDEEFFNSRTVICELGEIVDIVSSNKNDRAYRDAYTSLLKISSYQSRYENKATGEVKNFEIYRADITPKKDYDTASESASETAATVQENMFDSLNEDINSLFKKPKKYKKLIVRAVFSEKFINGLIENAIFVNKDVEKSYINKMTQALIMPLQNERYKRLNDEDTLNAKLGFNAFFNSVLTLGTSNKSRNLKNIEASLKEIQDSEKIIKSFYRQKDFFYIEFLPLSKVEKAELLNYIERMTSVGSPLKLPFSPVVDI